MSTNIHYIDDRDRNANGRTLGATINEAKEEFKQFAETRLAMLQAEMREKIQAIKGSAPMMVIGGLLSQFSFPLWLFLHFSAPAAAVKPILTIFGSALFDPFFWLAIVISTGAAVSKIRYL
jgi:hypothetical protein